MLEWLLQLQDVSQRLKKQNIDVVKLLWAQVPELPDSQQLSSPRSDFSMGAKKPRGKKTCGAPEVNGRQNYNWRFMETLETCEAKMQQSKECRIILYFYQLRPFQCWNRFNALIFCVMFQRCTGSAVSAIRIAWQMLAGRGSWSRPRCRRRESYNKVNISHDEKIE